jgi:hypothetical protein
MYNDPGGRIGHGEKYTLCGGGSVYWITVTEPPPAGGGFGRVCYVLM